MNKYNLKNRQKGSLFIEVLIAVVAVGIIGIIISQYLYGSKGIYVNSYNRSIYNEQPYKYNTTNTYVIKNNTTYNNTPPTITLLGENPYGIYHPGIIPACTDACPAREDVYKEPGFKAYDKEDGDITYKVKVTDEIRDYAKDPGPCTSYDKKYTVTDSGGITITARRTINECNGL